MSDLQGVSCGAHKINLVVDNSLFSSVDELLQKCRAIVGHFNHSNLAYDLLKEDQIKEGLPIHKLKQVIKTFLSKFDLFFRMLKRAGTQNSTCATD